MHDDLLGTADHMFETGNLGSALVLLERARLTRSDAAFRTYVDLRIARCLRRQGRLDEALEMLMTTLATCSPGSLDQRRVADLLITIGNLLGDQQQLVEAIDRLESARDISREIHYTLGLQQAQISIARCLVGLNRDDEAIQILTELLEAPPVTTEILTQVQNNLALLLPTRDGEQLLESNLNHVARDPYDRAVSAINLALIKRSMGKTQEALALTREAESCARECASAELEDAARRIAATLANG